MNGGQTICDSPVTDGLKAAEPSLVKKVGLHESKCILEHGSQHAPDTGESGRYLSSVSSVSVGELFVTCKNAGTNRCRQVMRYQAAVLKAERLSFHLELNSKACRFGC